MNGVRILVTGSRTWDHVEVIEGAIGAQVELAEGAPVTVIHGGARGADALAHRVGLRLGCGVEVYDADWDGYGKRAGYVRNQLMVDKGADVCLAFIRDDSRGATMCRDLALKAGIPTFTYRYVEEA